jgi:hypothetical protein
MQVVHVALLCYVVPFLINVNLMHHVHEHQSIDIDTG